MAVAYFHEWQEADAWKTGPPSLGKSTPGVMAGFQAIVPYAPILDPRGLSPVPLHAYIAHHTVECER